MANQEILRGFGAYYHSEDNFEESKRCRMQKGGRSNINELWNSNVQCVKFAGEVLEDSADLEELQPL